jgi:hypothetical protein
MKVNKNIYNNPIFIGEPDKKIKTLVETLRFLSHEHKIASMKLLIPDDCEKYGFVKGEHNLGVFLHFLADMLEE